MSYLGLVPSEYSSGASRRQGAITRCGNKHARRMLIEAAWNNRFKAQISRCLEVRQEGQPKTIRAISWKAQLRLTQYHPLQHPIEPDTRCAGSMRGTLGAFE